MINTVIINFRGGIISPGELYNILVAAGRAGLRFVSFGLRQQLLVDVAAQDLPIFTGELDQLMIEYEIDKIKFPNIISSYPAEEVFIRNTWLSEGVYKDILSEMNFKPVVKVNICDGDQSFTPMLTGNINWIASATAEHYWHLIIRFPKTNITFEWDQLCYTNHVAKVTMLLEKIITEHPAEFTDNEKVDGRALFNYLDTENIITKKTEKPVTLTQFNLPYYEGLNRYDNKYWLGVYRRDELFSIKFLKRLCQLCLDTKLGQLCCTSWKTIMIKGIEEKDKNKWNLLLEEFQINMRHAANELNFQVEDSCLEGLELKSFLIKHFSIDDTRTFGICFGIKTRNKSEIFSSILIRRRHLINFLGIKLISVYDILCAKDFNPNERTGNIYSSGNFKFLLPEELRRSVLQYYQFRAAINQPVVIKEPAKTVVAENKKVTYLYQCPNCFSVYDEVTGEPENDIAAETSFENLGDSYCCPVCETTKSSYKKIPRSSLGLQPA